MGVQCFLPYVHVWLILIFSLSRMHSASFSWRDYSGYGFWWDHLRGTIVLLCHIHSSIVKYSNLCATTYSVELFTSQNTLSCLFYVGSLNPRDNVRLTNNCNKPGVRAWSKIILLISVGWQTITFFASAAGLIYIVIIYLHQVADAKKVIVCLMDLTEISELSLLVQ